MFFNGFKLKKCCVLKKYFELLLMDIGQVYF
jgi:hypothetical protein